MTGFRPYLRLTWVALAAIVGMLSSVGEASACSVASAERGSRSCCAAGDTAACCCASPTPSAGVFSGPSPTGGGLAAPNTRCECRDGCPSDPAPKPESTTFERRTDQDRGGSADRIVEPRTAIAPASPTRQTGSPPRTPVYLRTSRLLI